MTAAAARIRDLGPLDRDARRALPAGDVDFLRWLGGSAIARVAGRDRARTRAIATLVHGNEPSGLRAVLGWLREGATPATDVVVWIASVEAALGPPFFAHRALPGHRDLNRCFGAAAGAAAAAGDGDAPNRSPEHALAAEALARLRAARPELLVDLHNNTGHNPAYAVGPAADAAHRAVAALFGRYFVRSDLALGALVEATDPHFPSVTIECGRAGSAEADAAARAGLDRLLADAAIPPCPTGALELLVDPVRVEVRPDVTLAIGDGPVAGAGFTMSADVDRHNFQRLEAGVPIGWVGASGAWPLLARGAAGEDRARDWFELRDGRVATRRPLVPIMMTTNPSIARSDCLFYIVRPA